MVASGKGNAPQVTVAVVSWNTRALLDRCLESLHDDASSGLADVWVVDNASADGSADLVRQRFPWVSLVPSKENLGFGAAVNLVAQRTASPWLAPANADVRLTAGALERLVATGEHHPEAAVIAPRLILSDGATQHSVYPFPTVPFTLMNAFGVVGISRRLARHWCINGGFDPTHPREVAWAVGAFLLVRRVAFNQVGGFDQAHWMYVEDLDLGWRLRRDGWAIRYEPAARIHHAESASTAAAWGDERYARWHASTYAWLLRRRGSAITRLVAGLNVAGFFVRAVVHAAAAVGGSKRSSQARRAALDTARAHSVGLRSRSLLMRVR